MPSGTVCSVATCKSNSKKVKKNQEHIIFFTFPKDHEIRTEWIRKCYRKDKFNSEYKRIRSLHFEPNDYEDELQARLTGSQLKKLKRTAIPSLNLLPPEYRTEHKESGTESTRIQRYKKRERQVLIEKILQEENIVESESAEQILLAQTNHKPIERVEESISNNLAVPSCNKE
ncbi:uncharacterized protein LOC143177427 [Calliopsis andreniformis]|uniref:uncharacterized protein LOC143177427 n=1 Tax=Calliopsis andreniformis TaxID=337506 RepID=UPI003FCE0AF5